MCVNNLLNVALDSAAAEIEPAISSRKSNSATPNGCLLVLYCALCRASQSMFPVRVITEFFVIERSVFVLGFVAVCDPAFGEEIVCRRSDCVGVDCQDAWDSTEVAGGHRNGAVTSSVHFLFVQNIFVHVRLLLCLQDNPPPKRNCVRWGIKHASFRLQHFALCGTVHRQASAQPPNCSLPSKKNFRRFFWTLSFLCDNVNIDFVKRFKQ